MKKAVVVGHTGQDGFYLSELLREKKYEVLGIASKTVTANSAGITLVDVMQADQVNSLLQKFQPNEVYFLAAVHQSSSDVQVDDGVLFQRSVDLNVKALIHFLDAIYKFSRNTRIFYAASSHVFGNPESFPQNENTPLKPDCIYGITKTAAIGACRFYRENHNVFASVGYFYNHESPRRASKYVSKKIIEGAVAIKRKERSELVLGNLESQIDWGYAPDYMHAVYEMMQLPKADEFVVASGEQHTIKDFVEGVFGHLGLNWQDHVKLNPGLITKKQKKNLFGNSEKLKKATGWSPSVDFKGLIRLLVNEEMKKYAK